MLSTHKALRHDSKSYGRFSKGHMPNGRISFCGLRGNRASLPSIKPTLAQAGLEACEAGITWCKCQSDVRTAR